MEFLHRKTHFDFVGRRRIPMLISALLVVATIASLAVKGLNFGLDFTGGTLVELTYEEPADIAVIRKSLADANVSDAVVQHFGSTRDVLVRLPSKAGKDAGKISNMVIEILRQAQGEHLVQDQGGQTQLCRRSDGAGTGPCQLQVRRVEFVGPQVGDELANKGGYALLWTLILILVYVMFRFEWRFAVGSVIAIAHDVLLTFGFFSVSQVEFDLPVLAAMLAVLGYSLNDTIVIFDRIRENFRTLRKAGVVEIMNSSLNQTLSRTIVTSGTTMLVLIALFLFGGEIIHGFAIALIVGVIVGTYSSIYIATPAVLALGISREDMIAPKKEDRPVDDLP